MEIPHKYCIFVSMKLSIIVPIYNSEKTLLRCIQSIQKQSFTNFEILLINDGSTDNSGRIADELALSDPRIKVIHKANGGLSDARNTGLLEAKGDYTTFVDSDDEVQTNTYLPLLETLQAHPEYDMLEYPVTERIGCPSQHIFMPKEKCYPDALLWLSENGFEHCWACNKIFKTTSIKGIFFPKGKKYEDVYFIGQYIARKPLIYTTSKGMYIYHWNSNGIVAEKNMSLLLEAQLYVVKLLNINTKESLWHRLYLDMFTIQLHAYKNSKQLLYKQRVSIKKYRSSSDIIKALMINILGVHLSLSLIHI